MLRKTILAFVLACALGVEAEPDFPYAAESLVGDAPYTIAGPRFSDGSLPPAGERIDIDASTDTLLFAGTYYLTLHLREAELTRQLDDTNFVFLGPDDDLLNDVGLTRAFGGDATDNSGVFKIDAASDLGIGTRIYVRFLNNEIAVPDRMPRKYRADVYLYERLGDARAAATAGTPADAPDSYLFRAIHDVDGSHLIMFEVARKAMAPTLTAHLATANVAASGGPFTGFEPNAETGTTEDTGVLTTITLGQADSNFFDAANGRLFDENVNKGATVEVTAEPGSFGFGTGTGDRERGIDPEDEDAEPLVPTAFNIADDTTDCTGGSPLTLTVEGKPIDPGATSDPTYSADADGGHTTVIGAGPFYFCVNTAGNTTVLPALGDEAQLDAYRLTATSLLELATDTAAAVEGMSGSGNGGAINRNGTSVNIAYLSLDDQRNQRLVIVNRCPCEVEYWMDSFQAEANTRVFGRIQGTLAPKSRRVIRVQDVLQYNRDEGMPRAAGIINLTAAERDIDIMTVQEETNAAIDTTIYPTDE
ncbi:MAG: hypothetical protein OXK76_18250 [Gammaproteobacteria bacterium]|nr:hypothetical protein [Gammaproteobacteria bacterium]